VEQDTRTDEALATLVQAGDHAALAVLVHRYEAPLRRYGRKFLVTQNDLDDVLQEVFIKAYQNIQSFDSARRFSPWIYRIAHNEFVSFLRRTTGERVGAVDLDTIAPWLVAREDATAYAEGEEMKRVLDVCLRELAPKYREPLVLRYVEDLSYEEIADVMQVPRATVGVRITRGKVLARAICERLQYHL